MSKTNSKIVIRAETNEWIAEFPNGGRVIRAHRSETRKWPFFNKINAIRGGLSIHIDATFSQSESKVVKVQKVAKPKMPETGIVYLVNGKNRGLVADYAAASKRWCQYRDEHDLGMSNSPLIELATLSGDIIGNISYNGRVWSGRGCVSMAEVEKQILLYETRGSSQENVGKTFAEIAG